MNYEELMQNKNYQEYESKYCVEEKEILALMSYHTCIGGEKFYDFWNICANFEAYIDLQTNELKIAEGFINWLLPLEICREKGCEYPYYFEDEKIYHLKVRKIKSELVPEGAMEVAYNNFMIVELLRRDVEEARLQSLIKEYIPIVIFDDVLGKLETVDRLPIFGGNIKWLSEEIYISLDIDLDDKETWQMAINNLKSLYFEANTKDKEFRKFAAKELTELANDWADEGVVITQKEFEERIKLEELSVNFEGNFTAYYNDDDMFYGHIIMIEGSLEKGLESADIAG